MDTQQQRWPLQSQKQHTAKHTHPPGSRQAVHLHLYEASRREGKSAPPSTRSPQLSTCASTAIWDSISYHHHRKPNKAPQMRPACCRTPRCQATSQGSPCSHAGCADAGPHTQTRPLGQPHTTGTPTPPSSRCQGVVRVSCKAVLDAAWTRFIVRMLKPGD